MGTMQTALENPVTGTQNQRKAATPPPATKRSGMDVVKALREAQARRQAAKTNAAATETAAAVQEETIEQVAELLYADEALTTELSELNRQKGRHPRGSVQAEEVRNLIDQQTENQVVVRLDLADIRRTNPSAYTEGTRRYNYRQEALEAAETNRALLGSATGADIRSRIAGVLEAGFIVASGDGDLKFDRQGYTSVWPNDLSVSDVATSLKELVDDLRERNDEGDQKIVAELVRGGFFISARRDPDGKGSQLPSELDLLRDEPGTVRKASEFLAGNGQRYIARVGGPRDFVVLEHRDSKFFAVKATSAKAGRALLTVPDRETAGARVTRRSAPEINNSGTAITLTDLSGVWYDPLRKALEDNLCREAESAERRETANELRDISGIENPLTLGDIALGGTGTAPVSIQYEDPENHRRYTVTFQVAGNGTSFSVTGTVPGTEETIKRIKRNPKTREVISSKPFLPEFIGKETPLGVLDKDPLWRLVRDLNCPFERDWRLARETQRQHAVLITRDNLDGLIGLEGQDGTYAVRATLRKNLAERGQEPRYVYNPVGYIVERSGSKVKVVWAVPGTSANYAERQIGNEYEIADLPNRLRFVLGNVHWSFTKEDAPAHLQPAKRQEATADTEE